MNMVKPASLLISGAIFGVNFIITIVLESLSRWEKPYSISEEQLIIVKKLWAVRPTG
jgi:hypothetical protein